MAPKAKNTLKQQALGFTTKRSAAVSNAKAKGSKSPATVPSTPTPVSASEPQQAGSAVVEEEQSAIVRPTRRRSTRASTKTPTAEVETAANKKRKLEEVEEPSTKAGKGKKKASKGSKIFKSRASLENVEDRQTPTRLDDSSDVELLDEPPRTDMSAAAKKARVRKHYGEVREKMGYLEPIHGKGQTKEHHILRVFDLSYEYGPCIGMTRLQRWERAEALGLNPPLAVKQILLEEQAKANSALEECVFFGEV